MKWRSRSLLFASAASPAVADLRGYVLLMQQRSPLLLFARICVLPDDVVSARRVWRVRWCVNGSGVSVLRCTALLPTACLVCDSAVLLGGVFALVGAVVAVAVAERAEQKRIESKRKES